MATTIKNGQTITLSTSEVAYILIGDARSIETLLITLQSGTAQATIASANADPVLDNTYAIWSTAGDKIILTIDRGLSTLRMKTTSAGVVNVNW